jgi:hypothetical protein
MLYQVLYQAATGNSAFGTGHPMDVLEAIRTREPRQLRWPRYRPAASRITDRGEEPIFFSRRCSARP